MELDISGMTCASCAARIEKKLNKLDGVQASVNYATEKAKVLYPSPIRLEDLIEVVANTGYEAALPRPEAVPVDHAAELRTRLVWAAVLGVPVIAMAMVPALQFPGWQWLSLAPHHRRSTRGRPGRSTTPRWSTPATAPPPWTP